jgi:hypothetical protein
MQAIKAREISPVSASSHPSNETHVLRYREVARRAGLGAALHLLRDNLGQRWCIWRTAVRSCLGHIRTQSAKGQATVGLGPHGHLGARNARTLVRTLYTQKLLAIHPWADLQDLEIFLMGFDAGETFASDSRDRLYKEQIPEVQSSWITPEIEHEIHITLDMLKRQWYKSQYESARHQDPSQSD